MILDSLIYGLQIGGLIYLGIGILFLLLVIIAGIVIKDNIIVDAPFTISAMCIGWIITMILFAIFDRKEKLSAVTRKLRGHQPTTNQESS